MHKRRPEYDLGQLENDMTQRGWLAVDLARKAGVSHMTVGRFLSGERQTPRTLKKLADALGYDVLRYLKGATSAESDSHSFEAASTDRRAGADRRQLPRGRRTTNGLPTTRRQGPGRRASDKAKDGR